MCLREHRGARPRPGWAGPPLYRAGPCSLGLVLSLAPLLGRGSVPCRARASGTCCAVSARVAGRGGRARALAVQPLTVRRMKTLGKTVET